MHQLKTSGVVDAPTLAAMNVPIEKRLQQVELNLERWRWMPDDFGKHHFMVNVPYFHLLARKDNQTVMDIRVVVGKPGNETPLFSDEMESVVFSPYWNIPDSIAQNETAPAMARDPAYLAKQNIEILRTSGGKTETDQRVRRELGQSERPSRPGVSPAARLEQRAGQREVPVPERVQRLPARHAG